MEGSVRQPRRRVVPPDAEHHSRAAQHRVPKPWCYERRQRALGGAHHRSRIGCIAGGAPSRPGVRRPGRGWQDRCRDLGARAPGRNLDQSQPRRGALAGHRAGGNQEQPRRHRRADSGHHQERLAVQPHDHQRGLRLVELRAGAFRAGRERNGGVGGRPLAVGNRRDVEGRAQQPGATCEGDSRAMSFAPGGTPVLWLAAATLYLTALLGPVAAADQKVPAAAPAAFDRISKAATEARARNRVEDAIVLYRQAVKLRPSWAEGWWFLGDLLYDQNKYAEGRDSLRRLIDLDHTTGPGFALLGLCEFETKEYDKALNHIYQARRLGLGDDPQVRRVVLFHEMLLLTQLKQYESAMQVLVNVVKDGGAGPTVIEAAGLAGLRRPIFPEELPPGDKDLIERTGRAVCAMAERDRAAAQTYFDELLAGYPKTPNVHYLYGSFLSATDKDGCLREYLKELELNPKHTEALATVALEYEARGDLDTAITYARRAVEADAQFFGAHAVLGKLLASAGQAEQGINELEIARQQASDSPQVHFSLATAYAMAGRKAEAAHEREEFARLKKLTDEIAQ